MQALWKPVKRVFIAPDTFRFTADAPLRRTFYVSAAKSASTMICTSS